MTREPFIVPWEELRKTWGGKCPNCGAIETVRIIYGEHDKKNNIYCMCCGSTRYLEGEVSP